MEEQENKEYVTCRWCGFKGQHIAGNHLKHKHPEKTLQDYIDEFPGAKYNTDEFIKKTTKNWHPPENDLEYKKKLSERSRGSNNRNSKENTTKLQRQQRSPFSIEFYIRKNPDLTLEQCNELMQEFFKKQSETQKNHETKKSCIEYWLKKGYQPEEAELLRKDYLKNTTLNDLDSFIFRHGEEEGTRRYNIRNERWQDTLNAKPQEEIDKMNKSKGKTYEEFVIKYGKEKADEICKSHGTTYEEFVIKYGKEKADEIRNKRYDASIKSLKNVQYHSKISIKLFKILNDSFPNCIYHGNPKEKTLFYIDEKTGKRKCYFLDFYCEVNNKMKCIEFYGDYWHANPKRFNENDIICKRNKKMKAKEIREKDALRIKIIKRQNVEVLIIWEHDFYNNK